MSVQDLKRGYSELIDAQEGYTKAAAYAKGASPEMFSNDIYANMLGLGTDKYQLNYSGIPVKLLSERVNYVSATVPENDPLTDTLSAIWEANEMPLEIQHFHKDAFMYGDNYVLVWLDENGEVDICPISPLETRMIYSEADQRLKEFAIRAWDDVDEFGDPVVRANLYYFDRIEKYSAPKKQEHISKMVWEPYTADGEEFPLYHEFGEIPVFHARPAGRPYGTPEHIDAYGAQDAIVKFTVTLMESVDYLAFPQRYLLHTTKADATGGMSQIGGGGAKGVNNNTSSNLKGGSRTIMELWADAIGQFEPSEPDNYTDPIDHFVKGMADVCRIDVRHFSSANGQHPSADALRAADAPLRARIVSRQNALAAYWSDVLTFVLKLSGVENLDAAIQINWAPQEIDNLSETVAMVGSLIKDVGMPQRAAMRYLGFTDEQMDAMGIPKLTPLPEDVQ